jgi:NTP pyrophosphatase (non-canonical NTP hydrolase)
MSDEPAWKVCEYHGRVFVWTLFSDGWARGHLDRPRLSLAQAEEIDGPLTAMDYIGTAAAILAEIARLQSLTTMLGANVNAMEAEIGTLTAERDRLRELAATCSCGTSPMTYEGPEPDCAVHGAVRAFNEASAELAEAYRMRNETMAVLRRMCAERDAALAAMERAVEERDRMERVAAEKTAAEFERNQLRDERDRLRLSEAKLTETIRAFPDANNAANIAHARSQRDAALASLAEAEAGRAAQYAEVQRLREDVIPALRAERVEERKQTARMPKSLVAELQRWASLAPGDDWGETMADTMKADMARWILGQIDGLDAAAAPDEQTALRDAVVDGSILSPSYLNLLDRLEKHFTEQGGVTLPLQLIKIQEELGEAAEAYVGMTGSNPRKGVTHTAADVAMELADVALTAMLAIRYAGHDVEAVLTAQAVKTEQRLDEYDQRPAIDALDAGAAAGGEDSNATA